jgi:hypothetical protein
MTNTDEVIFAAGADLASSTVYDTYSTTAGQPTQDATNIYTTTSEVNGNYIKFTSTRPTTPPASDTTSFTITPGTPTDMIWAYNSYDSTNGFNGVAYHSSNYSGTTGWTMTLNSNGSVSSAGDIAPEPIPAPTNANLIL